ncbi:metallophosphoesterase [Rhizobium sp. Root1220]|uniref:metallophosphoesterase n=1 Tax=Rhizobium sp. Root1220 TaxID=1736432 RepID=UPI0006F96981|nr:metallophosphoesterase [Rhizobium sp. Root1220]KQV82874.1 metallophosphoesterase [Rhizobium sp. Root1220]
MFTRRSLLKGGFGAGVTLALPSQVQATPRPDVDVTFLVINDVHACRIGDGLSPSCLSEGKTDTNLLRHIRALNNISRATWPKAIVGKATGFALAGQSIAKPQGIVVCGDVTDDGGGQVAEFAEGSQLLQFSHRYQQGQGADHVHFPVYVGLGNHDLDQDGRPPQIDWYRDELRDYVQMNHMPSVFFKPLVPVDNYDKASDNYSWNWGGLHLIQAQRYGGDGTKGTASSLDWMKRDLATYAADGRPVVIFQHYGWDKFSLERWNPARNTFTEDGSGAPHWWGDSEREDLLSTLSNYNVIGIFHGHEHDTPMAYKVNNIDIFKARAAYLGGFCLVRVTSDEMDVAIGDASDDHGGVIFTTAFTKRMG